MEQMQSKYKKQLLVLKPKNNIIDCIYECKYDFQQTLVWIDIILIFFVFSMVLSHCVFLLCAIIGVYKSHNYKSNILILLNSHKLSRIETYVFGNICCRLKLVCVQYASPEIAFVLLLLCTLHMRFCHQKQSIVAAIKQPEISLHKKCFLFAFFCDTSK